jgi:hypothetical protein
LSKPSQSKTGNAPRHGFRALSEGCGRGTESVGIPVAINRARPRRAMGSTERRVLLTQQTVCAPRFVLLDLGFVVQEPSASRWDKPLPLPASHLSPCSRDKLSCSHLSGRQPSIPMMATLARSPLTRTVRRRDLQGQHHDPLGSPPRSRDADDFVRIHVSNPLNLREEIQMNGSKK